MTPHAPPAPTRRPANARETHETAARAPDEARRPPLRPAPRPAARYAFSYDHELFRGSFATRDAALAAARRGLGGLGDRRQPPEALWVGRRRAEFYPGAFHPAARPDQSAPESAAVLDALRDRLAADSPARRALERAAPADLADLGSALDRALHAWLAAHPVAAADALPADAVEAISEHPLPLIHHAPEDPTRPDEVHMLGVEG